MATASTCVVSCALSLSLSPLLSCPVLYRTVLHISYRQSHHLSPSLIIFQKRVHQLPIISLYRVLCRLVPVPTRRRNKPHLLLLPYPSILVSVVFCPGFDSTAPTWNRCKRYRVQEQARVLEVMLVLRPHHLATTYL
ncbi:hypothetical protein GGI42DRAFT_135233 [Trichoderma sp. SZMC 28013]